ncbi:unannotated protein [freshwater metagenome]|uniref:Unannotated protein n=1 Tax=freshwater metagenome TaxID=449393 RepID=A0A6J6Q4K2_9ZZZZ
MKEWWLRTLLVLTAPRAVFAALRDKTDESAADRSEPILAITVLAGIAGIVWTRPIERSMDNPDTDWLAVMILVYLLGALYGAFIYWIGGAVLHWSVRSLGSTGTFRRNRQILAFAAVPIALSLVVELLRLAVYGSATFKTGGADSGAGGIAFSVIEVGFVGWTVALLLIGIRTLHGWTWGRAAWALGSALLIAVLLGLGLAFVGA